MTQVTKKRIQVQVNRSLANEGDAILERLGITPTTAITMFYKRLVAENGLPFSTKLTKREENELAIQKMTASWPVEDLDSSEKIKAWIDKDE